MIIGVDIGNSTTCTSENIIFTSKCAKISKQLNNKEVEISNEKFYVDEGTYDSEHRKVRKKDYLKFLFTALCLSANENKIELGLGLPLTQFKEDKEDLKNIIKENYHLNGYYDGEYREFYVTDCEVYPEGVACVSKNYSGIVIDIGGRTTDVALVESDGFKSKIINPISFSKGMIGLETEFINALNAKYGLDLNLDNFDNILKNGLSIYGEQQDISFAVDIFKYYLEDLLKEINNNYSLKLYNVLFTGGGSLVLAKPILNRLKHAKIHPNALFSNAYSYKKLMEAYLC